MRRFCITVLVVLPLCGCGKGRYEINGKVTLHNEPVEEGIIDFEPMDGQGSKEGALITDGVYRIPKEKGLFPGRYKVSIVAGDGTVGTGNADPEKPKRRSATPGKERIPPDYNVKSKVIREVKSGETTFDFDIP
jgi:hypothetical protein